MAKKKKVQGTAVSRVAARNPAPTRTAAPTSSASQAAAIAVRQRYVELIEQIKDQVAAKKTANEQQSEQNRQEAEEWGQQLSAAVDRVDARRQAQTDELAARTLELQKVVETLETIQGRINCQHELDEARRIQARFAENLQKIAKWNPQEHNGAQPWQVCALCLVRWTDTGDHVPHLMRCGHTLCSTCRMETLRAGVVSCHCSVKQSPNTLVKNFSAAMM